MIGVPIPEAAKRLGKSPATVRAWIRAGAPVLEPGSRGPGRAALVDVGALIAWRGSGGRVTTVDDRARIIDALLAFYETHEHDGKTLWQLLGLTRREAARIVCALGVQLLGDELPAEFVQIRSFAIGFR